MAHYVFIRLTETQLMSADVDSAEWIMIDKNDPQQILEKGTLYEPPVLGIGDKVVVSIPASKLMLTSVSLPKSNINRLRKIVPFTLEEYILDDLEDVHFAIGHNGNNEKTPIAVIQKELLSNSLASIEALGLSPTVMVSDCLCIPFEEQTWTIFVEDDIALVRTATDIGFSCTTDILILMLSQYIKEEDVTLPVSIKSYNVPQELQNEIMNISFGSESEPEVEFSTFDVSGNTEMLFLEQYLENTPSLNLLQGSYSRRQKMGQQFRPWIPLAGLLASYMVLALIIDIVGYNKLSSNLEQLRQEQTNIFKRAFPDARKIVNPRIQMESRLKSLRKKSGKNSSSATVMLAFTAKILRKYKIVGIKSVRYINSKLDLDVKLKNLQALDQLKEKLSNNGKWKVEILSATSREDFVESRIQIRG
ncbi:MAG: type II secretion system protein GspL [Gammaproteobacteria bacterium]